MHGLGPWSTGLVSRVVVVAVILTVVAGCVATESPSPSPSTLAASLAPSLDDAPTVAPSPSPSTPPPIPIPIPSPTPAPGPTPCPGGSTTSKAAGPLGLDSSTNWSGYAATTSKPSVTCVEAEWVEPTPTCSSKPAFSVAATWVGIGGWASKDPLVQIGTEAECSNGLPVHDAWFEVYPTQGHSFPAGVPVYAGDAIWASVRYAGGAFTLGIINLTRERLWSVVEHVSKAKRESAEWVVESPSHGCPRACAVWPMPRFGTIRIRRAFATIGGKRVAIDDPGFIHYRVTMVRESGTIRARPSGLGANGTGFTVTWVRS